jgi:predicted RNase H-like HicB family nuclease
MANYIAIVHKEAKSDFGVSFPDFPGCVTAGQTVDEAKDSAQEALSLHINGMVEDGDQLPSPSKLEDIMADEDSAEAVAYLVVSVPDTKPRTVRVNITVPEMTLKQIDAAAKKRGMSIEPECGESICPFVTGRASQPSAEVRVCGCLSAASSTDPADGEKRKGATRDAGGFFCFVFLAVQENEKTSSRNPYSQFPDVYRMIP